MASEKNSEEADTSTEATRNRIASCPSCFCGRSRLRPRSARPRRRTMGATTAQEIVPGRRAKPPRPWSNRSLCKRHRARHRTRAMQATCTSYRSLFVAALWLFQLLQRPEAAKTEQNEKLGLNDSLPGQGHEHEVSYQLATGAQTVRSVSVEGIHRNRNHLPGEPRIGGFPLAQNKRAEEQQPGNSSNRRWHGARTQPQKGQHQAYKATPHSEALRRSVKPQYITGQKSSSGDAGMRAQHSRTGRHGGGGRRQLQEAAHGFTQGGWTVHWNGPACQAVRHSVFNYSSPLLTNWDLSEDDVRRDPQARVLLWTPRYGLGNALRSFSSALVYALLSGRQLLRWHTGPHRQVADGICLAFECAVSAFQSPKVYQAVGPTMKIRKVRGKKHDHFLWQLMQPAQIVVVHEGIVFDDWVHDASARQCVMEALGCAEGDLWCPRHRAMSLLFSRPSATLNATLQATFSATEPLSDPSVTAPIHGPWTESSVSSLPSSSPNNGTTAAQSVTELSVPTSSQSDGAPAEYPLRSIPANIDVALHFRTQEKCLEGPKSEECAQLMRMRLNAEQIVWHMGSESEHFLLSSNWATLSNLLVHLRALKLSLLQPRKDDKMGGVEGSQRDYRLPGGPQEREWFQRFLQRDVSSVAYKPKKRYWSEEDAWAFIAMFQRGGQGAEAGTQSDSNGRRGTAHDAAEVREGAVGKGEAGEAAVEGEGEASTATPITASSSSLRTELVIYLATDSELFRPLLVRFLRPFGVVIHSQRGVTHPSHLTGSHEKLLPTFAEYHVLSRAAILVSVPLKKSSFVEYAAVTGECSLVRMTHNARFKLLHLGLSWSP